MSDFKITCNGREVPISAFSPEAQGWCEQAMQWKQDLDELQNQAKLLDSRIKAHALALDVINTRLRQEAQAVLASQTVRQGIGTNEKVVN